MRTVVSSVALVVGSLGVDGADEDWLGVSLTSSVGSSSLSPWLIRSSTITTIATRAITARTGHTQLRRSVLVVRRAVVGGGSGATTWVAGAGGGATTWVAAVAGLRSAAANAAPSANRSAGSFASARRTTAARSAGTEAGRSGIGSRRWASAVATAVSPTNGRRPARHSKATTPRE